MYFGFEIKIGTKEKYVKMYHMEPADQFTVPAHLQEDDPEKGRTIMTAEGHKRAEEYARSYTLLLLEKFRKENIPVVSVRCALCAHGYTVFEYERE